MRGKPFCSPVAFRACLVIGGAFVGKSSLLCLSLICVCVCVFQGEIVNNIEIQVSKSVDHIAVAKSETKKAIKYQSKARKVL